METLKVNIRKSFNQGKIVYTEEMKWNDTHFKIIVSSSLHLNFATLSVKYNDEWIVIKSFLSQDLQVSSESYHKTLWRENLRTLEDEFAPDVEMIKNLIIEKKLNIMDALLISDDA